jgi:hypothetical protein
VKFVRFQTRAKELAGINPDQVIHVLEVGPGMSRVFLSDGLSVEIPKQAEAVMEDLERPNKK